MQCKCIDIICLLYCSVSHSINRSLARSPVLMVTLTVISWRFITASCISNDNVNDESNRIVYYICKTCKTIDHHPICVNVPIPISQLLNAYKMWKCAEWSVFRSLFALKNVHKGEKITHSLLIYYLSLNRTAHSFRFDSNHMKKYWFCLLAYYSLHKRVCIWPLNLSQMVFTTKCFRLQFQISSRTQFQNHCTKKKRLQFPVFFWNIITVEQ